MGWFWLPVRGPVRAQRIGTGCISNTTKSLLSTDQVSPRGVTQFRQRQKEEWAALKRLLTEGEKKFVVQSLIIVWPCFVLIIMGCSWRYINVCVKERLQGKTEEFTWDMCTSMITYERALKWDAFSFYVCVKQKKKQKTIWVFPIS